MRDAILPFAVMVITVSVALGLMAFFRRLLKLRRKLAPEVVYARDRTVQAGPARETGAHRFAA